uniref:Integrase core domain containing protein n=1 Tax=Solanum tuberosum TaxID=4113 RepID=M1DKX6_SOLTU
MAVSFEDDDRLQHGGAIATRSLVQKKEDPGAFTISCTIGLLHFAKALCDLVESINLMPLSIYKKLSLGTPKPTAMRLLMADRTVKKPIGVIQDMLVKVELFIFLVNFVILDCEVDFEVPIIATKTLDIGLIRDEVNVAAPRREPQVEVYPLGADFVADVEQMQGDEPAPPAPTEDSPASHSSAASQARIQKLKAQLASLLQLIRPWMKWVIDESATRVEQRMEQMMDRKVQVVHQRLDAFELRVLERPAPTTYVSFFQTELASLWANLDTLIAPPETEPASAPMTPIDNMMFDALFGDEMPPLTYSLHAEKRPHSSWASDDTETVRVSKRECQETEAARRDSIIDKELRH